MAGGKNVNQIVTQALRVTLLLILSTTFSPAQEKKLNAIAAASAAHLQPQPAVNPLASISLSSLEASRERPIFFPSRRSPPSSHLQNDSRRNGRLVLLGAIASGPNGIAILRDQDSKAVMRVRVGGTLLGWRLVAVEGRNATLTGDTGQIELTIPSPAPK